MNKFGQTLIILLLGIAIGGTYHDDLQLAVNKLIGFTNSETVSKVNQIELDELSCKAKSLKSEILIKNLNQKQFNSEYNSYTLNSNINANANTNGQINKSTSLNSLNKLKKFSQTTEFILPEEEHDEHTNPSVNINKHMSENLDETISIEFDFNNNNNDNTNKIENCFQLIKKLNF